MNGQNPETGAVELTSMSYKDRSAGLKVFGILTILLGGLAGLLSVFMLLGQLAIRNTGAPAVPFWTLLPIFLIYLLLAVVLVWLGIGSIQARRWARALLLIISWSWLLVGVTTSISMFFMMPKLLANSSGAANTNQSLPQSALVGAMVIMGIVFGVIFVIMPAIWTVFYQSRHVKATCEALDTVTRWTDACPLPVLAISLWLACWVPWLLGMPLMGHPLMPFFGTFLTGLPGTLVSVVLTAICICAAWLLYKLDVRGWWLALITMVLYWVSTVITYSRHDFTEMYQLMGYSAAQLEQMQKFNSFGQHMTWISLIYMVPFIGYILFTRKYFPRRSVT